MDDALKKDLEQQVQNLYEPLAAANIAFHNTRSSEDANVVQALEEQINTLIELLMALDAKELQH